MNKNIHCNTNSRNYHEYPLVAMVSIVFYLLITIYIYIPVLGVLMYTGSLVVIYIAIHVSIPCYIPYRYYYIFYSYQ